MDINDGVNEELGLMYMYSKHALWMNSMNLWGFLQLQDKRLFFENNGEFY
jgi:hypothetical protein